MPNTKENHFDEIRALSDIAISIKSVEPCSPPEGPDCSSSACNTKKRNRDGNNSHIDENDLNDNELQLSEQLNKDHADIFTGDTQYENFTIWVYIYPDRTWYECSLIKYINKENSNMGIRVKWTQGNMIAEYTSEQMKLSIRFNEPTDEEKKLIMH